MHIISPSTPTAYTLYHKLEVEFPSLSFSILPDTLGEWRQLDKPATMYLTTGTQAPHGKTNYISLIELNNLHPMKYIEDSDEDEDEDEDDEELPNIFCRKIPHEGCVNRIRTCKQSTNLLSTWSDQRMVYIWNIGDYKDLLVSKEHNTNT